jgi:cephalosporin hydroxylase
VNITLEGLNKLIEWIKFMPAGMGDEFLSVNPESGWALYYRFLWACVSAYIPEVVVECGVYRGTATEHMAVAHPKTLVIGIDQDFHPDAYGVEGRRDNVRLISGYTTSKATLDSVKMYCGSKRIGLLFLDSAHDSVTPKREFEKYKPLFADVCIVACDDINQEAMQDFWDWLPGEKKLYPELHVALHGDNHPGFAVSIIRSE